MPRLAKKEKRSRLGIEVPVEFRKTLERLRVQIGADSLSETIRTAVSVYDCLRRYHLTHGTIFVGVYRPDLPDTVKVMWVLN